MLQNSKYARTCTEMFIRAQFLILQNWKKMKMSSTIEWTQRKGTVFEVQFNSLDLSRVQLCDPMDCSTSGLPTIINSWTLLTLMSIKSVMPSNILIPFSSYLQSLPLSGSFQMSQFFASSGQSIRASAAASVLPMNIHEWFPSEWTSLISLQSKGLARLFSNTTLQKHQFFCAQLSLQSNSHTYTWYWKNHSFD